MSKSILRLIVYFLLLLVGSFQCYAQQLLTKKEYYDKAKKQLARTYQVIERSPAILEGKTINYFINGKVKSEGLFKKNKPTGIWKFYFENGNLKNTSFFWEGKQEGAFQQFYESGKLAVIGFYSEGIKDSLWQFFSERGYLEAEHFYKRGLSVGTWKGFYENKQLRWERFFSVDKSIRVEYFENGKIKSEGILRGDASDSVWSYYHEEGALKARGEERAGLRVGCWSLFDKQGNKEAEGCYENGLATGEWKYYFPNGALKNAGKFEEGKKEGEWRLYFNNGDLAGEGVFAKGSGEFKEFYPDGKLKTKGFIADGKPEGEWQYFYEEGTLEGKALFESGKGAYTGYYRDGGLKTSGTIENGQKVGTWSLYDKTGLLIGTISSFAEEKTGLTPLLKSVPDSSAKVNKVFREAKIAKFNRSKFYLKPKNTESWYLGFGVNPIGPFRSRLPFSVEYIIPERVGIELTFALIRSPFLGDFNNPTPNSTFERGYSVTLKHKFFNKDKGFGSFYVAPDIRYLNYEWFHNFQTISVPIQPAILNKARWEALELAASFGWRSDKNLKDGNKLGVDIFIGPSIGRKVQLYNPNDFNFSDKNQNNFYIGLRFGVVLFYMFKYQ